MKAMAKKINIRPTSGVYATYKRLSYQPWSAIAEFVDNSTQSFFDNQSELLAVKYAKGLSIYINYIENKENGDRLEISDNAYGMEWADFQRAIILDRPPQNTNGRNEFGMGLKTAACWFGSLWSVESTQLNSINKYYAEINIDVLGKYKSEEIDVREEIVSPKDHYTKIVIKNLNKKISGTRTTSKVKELLSSIYREDIRSDLVKIYYNATLLQFKEVQPYKEDSNGQEKEWKKNISFAVNHDGKELAVTGFIAIRIPGSVKDAGFTLLRRGRVIIGGSEKNYRPNELFGDSNSFAWQRLYGELHMNDWPVTQAKDSFDWHNSSLEEAFIETLDKLIDEYRRKADSIRVRERINTRDLVQAAISGLSNSGVVENIKIEIVERPQASVIVTEPHNTSASTAEEKTDKTSGEANIQISNIGEVIVDPDDTGVIIDGGDQWNYNFRYKGIEQMFHIVFDGSDPTAHWLLVEVNSDVEYTLIINMRHSFFKPLIEKPKFLPIMTRIAIALVLAEVESLRLSPNGMINTCDIRLKMNDILDSIRSGDDYNG